MYLSKHISSIHSFHPHNTMLLVFPFSDEATEAHKGWVTVLSIAIQVISGKATIQTQRVRTTVSVISTPVLHYLCNKGEVWATW